MSVLEIRDLHVSVGEGDDAKEILKGVDLTVRSGETHGWAKVELDWTGGSTPRIAPTPELLDGQIVVKRELLPDGRAKLILKDPATGVCSDRVM